MKRILWMVLLTLALPMAAFASSSVDFTNSGGTLMGSSAGLSLTGSELIAVNGLNGGGLVTGDLGSVAFSTGALTGGSLQMGATFAAGGSFVITGTGSYGVLFNGSFWPRDLDAGNPGERDPQLHADRLPDGNLVHRGDCARGDCPVDNQHGQGLL